MDAVWGEPLDKEPPPAGAEGLEVPSAACLKIWGSGKVQGLEFGLQSLGFRFLGFRG